jgi:hypothetical protein
MKVTKKQLENMIRESVEEEIGSLNEEELNELLGGLKNLFGTGAKAVQGAAQSAGKAVSGAAQTAGRAVSGAAQKAGTAISGVAGQAAGAVKGAYQQGEKTSALSKVGKELQNAIANGATREEVLDAVNPIIRTIPKPASNVPNNPPAPKAITPVKEHKTLRRKTK